ncbi:MAG: UDP-3-O-acyl-N-acetylglucosamine deacetylase [Pseudomonadota bacterium]
MSSRLPDHQTTLKDRIDLSGAGVHTGKPVSISLLPAEPNTGVVFQRCDIDSDDCVDIPANMESISGTELCTILGDPSGACVATVEHLMAALRALNVDNVYVEIDSMETPVMDGSSEVFVDAIDQVGLVKQAVRRRYIKVLKPVRIEAGGSWAEFVPHETTRYEVEIDFDAEVIGRQKYCADLTPDVFRNEVCRARTFGFMKDVERLWAAGFALGSSLENSVVIGDDDKIVNPEGLRYENEFVKHKFLDAVGDLALAGAPILGCYRSYRGGHKINATALRALMSDETAFEIVEVPVVREANAPAELTAIAAPAFGPDVS